MKQFFFYCSNDLRNILATWCKPYDAAQSDPTSSIWWHNNCLLYSWSPSLLLLLTNTSQTHHIAYSTTFASFPTCTRRPWTLSRILEIYWPLEGVTIRIPINSLLFTPLNHMESRRCKCPALSSGWTVTLTSSWHKIIWGKITQLQDPQLYSNLLPNMVGIICVPSKFTLFLIGSRQLMFSRTWSPPGSSANSVCRTGSIGSGGSCKVTSSASSESSRNDHSNPIGSMGMVYLPTFGWFWWYM